MRNIKLISAGIALLLTVATGSQSQAQSADYTKEAPVMAKACIEHLFTLKGGPQSLLTKGYGLHNAAFGLQVYYKNPAKPKRQRSAPFRMELHSAGHMCKIELGGDKSGKSTFSEVEATLGRMGFRKAVAKDSRGRPYEVYANGGRIFTLSAFERRDQYGSVSSNFTFFRE